MKPSVWPTPLVVPSGNMEVDDAWLYQAPVPFGDYLNAVGFPTKGAAPLAAVRSGFGRRVPGRVGKLPAVDRPSGCPIGGYVVSVGQYTRGSVYFFFFLPFDFRFFFAFERVLAFEAALRPCSVYGYFFPSTLGMGSLLCERKDTLS